MKRRFPRFSADLPVAITVIGDRGAPAIHGRCNVVSENGLGATLSGEIAVGNIVSADLYFPSLQEMIRVWATVKHSQYPYYGVEFFSLIESQRDVIKRYCRPNAQTPRAMFLDVLRKYLLAGKDRGDKGM